MVSRRLVSTLGYAGLIPFIGGAIGVWLFRDYLHAFAQQGFLLYSLAILCFLGGTLWGSAPQVAVGERTPRILISNGVVLFAVFAYLTAQPLLAALLLLLGHLTQLWYERSTLPADWYRRLRTRLTLVAGGCHGIYLAGLILVRPT
jgi:hypothetical protein